MQLINSKYFCIISLSLLFLACNKEEGITEIINPYTDSNLTNALNLQSNSGVNLNSVTISWGIDGNATIRPTPYSPYQFHNITTSETVYTFDTQPNTFIDIAFELITPTDSTYNDTIQIYTRDVYSVTNLTSIIEQKELKNTFFV